MKLPFYLTGWIFFFVLIVAGPIHAQEQNNCSTIDLSNEIGSQRDQGNTGDCYAMAAADLLGHAIGVRPPEKVSALDIYSRFISLSATGLISAQKKVVFENLTPYPSTPSNDTLGWVPRQPPSMTGIPLLTRQSGLPDLALTATIDAGHVCMESEIPSQGLAQETAIAIDKNVFERALAPPAPVSDPVEARFFLRNFKPMPPGFFQKQIMNLSSAPNYGFLYSGGIPINPLISCENYVDNVKELHLFNFDLQNHVQDWAVAKLRSTIDSTCKNPRAIGSLKVHDMVFHSHSPEDQRLARQAMQDNLKKGNPFLLVLKMNDLSESYNPAWAASHAILAVGRRWNSLNHNCEIEVQNSWGETCPEKLKPDVHCENGEIFVPMDKLAATNHEMITLEKQ